MCGDDKQIFNTFFGHLYFLTKSHVMNWVGGTIVV